MRNFTPVEEHAELARLARLMCAGVHGERMVDVLVVPGQPELFLDGYVLDPSSAQPAWCRYLLAAKLMFDDQRRQEEMQAPASDLSI